jgi:DNA-binding Lrp family transcriptional regulator
VADIIDLLIKWALVQYETLKYIDERSRSASKFVTPEEAAQDLGISVLAARNRLERYEKKEWLKRIEIDEQRKGYVLKLEGLKRYKWLRVLVDTATAEGLLTPTQKRPAEGEQEVCEQKPQDTPEKADEEKEEGLSILETE